MGVNIQVYKEIDIGSNVRIEVSILELGGFKVFLTAKDGKENRIWRTALSDSEGAVKIYSSIPDAIRDAEKVISNSTSHPRLALSA